MIKLFLHIATMGSYQLITDEIISDMINSGLVERSDELNVCVVGDGILNLPDDPKIKLHRVGRIDEFEFPTLQFIEDTINKFEDNIKVLYANGLGVTDNSIYKQSWRGYITYFNIIKHKECIEALDYFDTCGVDWRTDPVPHYSGNIWWANSNYLKTLPKIQTLNKQDSPRVLTLRHNAEMYIGMNPNTRPRILHQSNVSQYCRHLETYPKENYIDNINQENVSKAK